MIKVKWKVYLIVGSLLILLCGCETVEKKENFYVIKDEVTLPEETIADMLQETDLLLTATDSILRVYYPDQGMEYIISEKVEVDIITENEIMQQLHEKGFLDMGVEVKEISAMKENEQVVLFVNFSIDFSQQLNALDNESKRIVLGSVVNTFLTAYHAVAMEVKIEGARYFDGELLVISEEGLSAEEKKGYYTAFPAFIQSTMEAEVVIDGTEEVVTYEKAFCNEEFVIYYERDNFVFSYDEEIGKALFLEKKSISPNEITNQFSIYIVEESKKDTVSRLTENGLGEVVEVTEETIGDGYLATVITKQGETSYHKWRAKFYVFENAGNVHVVEALLEENTASEFELRITQMLNTLYIIQ